MSGPSTPGHREETYGINRARLMDVLTRELGPQTESEFGIELVAGGQSNLTYRFRWGGDRYVLRRPPIGDYNPRSHDVAREFRIISALSGTGVPIPRAILLCSDPEVLGAPFYLMSHVAGRVLSEADPVPDMRDPVRLELLGRAMIDGLVALHTIDPESVGLADLGNSDKYVRRQVERWTIQWESTQERAIPALDEVGQRLRMALESGAVETVPHRPYLVHGDYNLGNVIVAGPEQFDDGEPLRAVLDWEMATLGHPLIDLGVLATYNGPHANRVVEVDRHVSTLSGFPSVERLVEHYADCTGRDVSAFPFFHVLAFFKVLVLTEDVRSRFARGTATGAGADVMGQSVPELAEALIDIADRSELPGLSGTAASRRSTGPR